MVAGVIRVLNRTTRRVERILDMVAGSRADTTGVEWLFIATLPNSGSTALAQLLTSARAAIRLNSVGEGQWLVPQMSAPIARWQAEYPVDFQAVRRCWLGRVQRIGIRPCLVIEKSPASLVRFREVLAAFSDMPTHAVSLTRDPYAVCASWAKRYEPSHVRDQWGVHVPTDDGASPEFYRVLARLYGERSRTLLELDDIATRFSYEQMAEKPEVTLDRFKALSPLLADADPEARLRVKDYGALELDNMNARQTAGLTDAQTAAISEGLQPFAEYVRAMGYSLR